MIDLVLFPRGEGEIARALAAGLRSIIVDLEARGKEERQSGADTEINRLRPEDLAPLAAAGVPRRWCRLDRFGGWTRAQAEAAVAAGATDLLLPMAESAADLDRLRRWVGDRCTVGILVETADGVRRAGELSAAAPAAVYVGLNDLAISRRTASIFEAVADGTVERLRDAFEGVPFGFGGVTVIDRGSPVPCRLLLAEMVRLGCAFSFLRRSFHRDVAGVDWRPVVGAIAAAWERLRRRDGDEVAADRRELVRCIAATPTAAARTA